MSCLFGRPDGAGTAGDLFGAIGALFSGWAFVGVLWAILLQRRSLQIQHEDLKATLAEVKQAREAHEESAGTLARQVETARLQIRANIITTLIEAPLKADMSTFLKNYKKHLKKQTDEFPINVEELQQIHDILRDDTSEKPRKD